MPGATSSPTCRMPEAEPAPGGLYRGWEPFPGMGSRAAHKGFILIIVAEDGNLSACLARNAGPGERGKERSWGLNR